jgi:hypothetical protein
MPFVPLFAWATTGILASSVLAWLRARAPESPAVRAGGAPAVATVGMVLAAIAGAALAAVGTTHRASLHGGTVDRTHPAVILNVLDLAARGCIVLGAGVLLAPLVHRVPRLEAGFLRLGRGSLVAYVFHIPFCYGAFGAAWRERLSMGEATLGVLVLATASFLAVVARDELRDRIRGTGKVATT